MTPSTFVRKHGDPTTWSSADFEAYENTADTHALTAVTLTKNTVTAYELGTGRAWARFSHRDAETELAASSHYGDTVQEYATTDRGGRPLRLVLHQGPPSPWGPYGGDLYEFTR